MAWLADDSDGLPFLGRREKAGFAGDVRSGGGIIGARCGVGGILSVRTGYRRGIEAPRESRPDVQLIRGMLDKRTMATAQEKVCIACQQDVSAKPRSKDAHGRYVCKECEAKALETGAAKRAQEASASAAGVKADGVPSAAKVGQASVKASSGATSAAGGYNLFADIPQPCPSCSAPMKDTAHVCTICGFNKETGKILRTQISAEKGAKKPKGGFKFFR